MRKKIEFKDQARREIRAIDRVIALQILRGLDRFSATGEGDVKRLQNVEPAELRLRIGEYRVRFHDLGASMLVLSVKHRSDAYR